MASMRAVLILRPSPDGAITRPTLAIDISLSGRLGSEVAVDDSSERKLLTPPKLADSMVREAG